MTSVKLTTWMREDIVRDILAYRFKGVYERALEDFAVLARDVYDDVFTRAEQRRMKRLPAGWLPEADCIGAQFGDTGSSYQSLEFNGTNVSHGLPTFKPRRPFEDPKVVRRLFPNSKHRTRAVKYEKDHTLSVRYFVISNTLQKRIAEHAEAKKMAERGVMQATTVGRLIEVWPEVAHFAKRFSGEEYARERKLPVVQIEHLNAVLGLPPGESVGA